MPRRLLSWASYFVGNRGVMAVILGVIWTLIGVSTMLGEGGPAVLPDSVLPLWVRGVFWIVPGLYAIAWTAMTPIRQTADHNVWALLMIGPTARFFTFVAAGIMDLVDWHEPRGGYKGVWLGILAWLAVLAMVDRCAVGLDRLPPRLPRPPEAEDGLK
jgi:hypothetical protein